MPWIRDMQWIGFEEIMYKLFLLFANLIFYLFIFPTSSCSMKIIIVSLHAILIWINTCELK